MSFFFFAFVFSLVLAAEYEFFFFFSCSSRVFLAESDSRLLFSYARLIVNPLIQKKKRKEKGDTAGHSFLCFFFFFV